jgi:type IV fimbrial biogenesis protein FimT
VTQYRFLALSPPVDCVGMKRQTGFNLTELMIVVAIVAVLLSIGVPSYRYITNSYRMSSEVNGLMGDLMFARAEAIKEGSTITACTSKDGATCDAGNTKWQEGWIVFQDVNQSQAVDNVNDHVLHVQQQFNGTDTFTTDNGISAVTFNREGFATTAAGAPAGFPNATWSLKDATANPTWTRCLFVTTVGLLTTETPATLAPGSPGCPTT